MFELHPQLAKDCFLLGELPLCSVLMMNDYHYPWFILVPRREDIRETFQLEPGDQEQLSREINYFAEQVQSLFKAHKMNIAALGNQVPQLHVHIIGRFNFDTAWPHPVWGRAQNLAMEKQQLMARIETLQQQLEAKGNLVLNWDEQW